MNLWKTRLRGHLTASCFSLEQSLVPRNTASCSASPLKINREEAGSSYSIRDLGHKKEFPDFEKC